MANPVTADDLLPLISALPVAERVRLLRLLTSRPNADVAGAYDAQPVGLDEFSADDDPNDDMVVEVAVASQADCIVTHNLRDFGPAKRFGLQVLAPGTF